jgi:single-strand DNA-binding protein
VGTGSCVWTPGAAIPTDASNWRLRLEIYVAKDTATGDPDASRVGTQNVSLAIDGDDYPFDDMLVESDPSANMSDMAIIALVGRLTRDAELKYTPSGQAVLHFAVATSSRVKSGEQWVDEPSFWDVDLWGKRGESISQYLTKGKLVAVNGPVRIQTWEKDGIRKHKPVVTANDVAMLGKNENGSGGHQDAPYQAPPQAHEINTGQTKTAPPVNTEKVKELFGKGNQGSPSHVVTAADGFDDEIPF